MLIDREGLPNGCGSAFPTLLHSLAVAIHLEKKSDYVYGKLNEAFNIDYVLGADMFTPKGVFDKLKGFDESFFMYFEESDLQRRANKIGLGARIIPGPRIVHLEGKSTGGISHKKRMMVEKSHMIHLRKHYSRITFNLFLMIYIILKTPVFLTRHYTLRDNKEYFKMLISAL